MFKNRFVLILMVLSVLLVTVAVSQRFSKALELSQPPRPVIVPVTGVEEASPYTMDSATRSYIAWGEALRERNAIDSGTRSYIAWGEALSTWRFGKKTLSAGSDLNWLPSSNFSYLRERNISPSSYRSPLDECFDVPLREVAQCRNENETPSR